MKFAFADRGEVSSTPMRYMRGRGCAWPRGGNRTPPQSPRMKRRLFTASGPYSRPLAGRGWGWTARKLPFGARPTLCGQPFLRFEATLVMHFARTLDPIAKVDVRQPHTACAFDVIEDHERTGRPRGFVGLE